MTRMFIVRSYYRIAVSNRYLSMSISNNFFHFENQCILSQAKPLILLVCWEVFNLFLFVCYLQLNIIRSYWILYTWQLSWKFRRIQIVQTLSRQVQTRISLDSKTWLDTDKTSLDWSSKICLVFSFMDYGLHT